MSKITTKNDANKNNNSKEDAVKKAPASAKKVVAPKSVKKEKEDKPVVAKPKKTDPRLQWDVEKDCPCLKTGIDSDGFFGITINDYGYIAFAEKQDREDTLQALKESINAAIAKVAEEKDAIIDELKTRIEESGVEDVDEE